MESDSEQALRAEAVRRRLLGQRVCAIGQDLGRSPRWVNKWWREFCAHPQTDFASKSRSPHRSPRKLPESIEQAVVSVRRSLEAGLTPQTRYGLIGSQAVRGTLEGLGVSPVPSPASVQRVLARHGLTHPVRGDQDRMPYPWILPWSVNALHATDIITKHLRGGEAIQNFHSIDVATHAVCLTQYLRKTSASARHHVLQAWAMLGLPWIHQFDNESAFSGGPTHKRVLGAVVRLCLYCQVEPLFIPYYEAKRNHWIETFHSLWAAGFWRRHQFGSLSEVQQQVPLFLTWYQSRYRPPALSGRTPQQQRETYRVPQWLSTLPDLVPATAVPLTAGRIHLIRKVTPLGTVSLLNESWFVGKRWIGHYVRATIRVADQKISFWTKADGDAPWQHLKTRMFRIGEAVHDVRPRFRRKSERCLDHLPA
jgi:hypothetical protein